MRNFVADLHVHSLLSPCAAVEMTPRHLVKRAIEYGIDIIAITDHNSSYNVRAAIQAAKGTNIKIIPGMEVETMEEIHLITLFERVEQLDEWQRVVNRHLPAMLNDEQRFGAQFVVDAEDNLLEICQQMLLTPVELEVAEVVKQAKALEGMVIASHIDRPSYSIITQLGFIPDELLLDGVEIARYENYNRLISRFLGLQHLPVVTNSDAHTIADFYGGPKMLFLLESPSLREIGLALTGRLGRKAMCNYFL